MAENKLIDMSMDFDVTNFKIKKVDTHIVQSQEAKNNGKNVSTDDSLSQDDTTVNNNSMQDKAKKSLSDEIVLR